MEQSNLKEEKELYRQKVQATKQIFERLDNRSIPVGKNEIRLFAIARNESLRLPYFLEYYKKMGVDRFFIIDNNSTDNTASIAISSENTHVFKIDYDFKHFWCWMEYFLEEYGKNRWCLVVDIDELLYYPRKEICSLKILTKYLETYKYTAVKALLVDIYSDKPIKDTNYSAGEDPLKVCDFFDSDYSKRKYPFFDKKQWRWYDQNCFYGGMRQRVFGTTHDLEWFFCLSKVPLFKYSSKTYLNEGQHAMNGAVFADLELVVLHTKFLYDFVDEAAEEATREQYYLNSIEYKIYDYHLSKTKNLRLKYTKSKQFSGYDQLAQLGMMVVPQQFISFIDSHLVKV